MAAPSEICVSITADSDIVTARQKGRELAQEVGLLDGDSTVLAAAISEVARNIVSYAGKGEIVLKLEESGGRRGIVVIARDKGPGIADIELALQDGYSTSGGFGLGLPGVRRLMDEFEIVSELDKGTIVTMKKWKR